MCQPVSRREDRLNRLRNRHWRFRPGNLLKSRRLHLMRCDCTCMMNTRHVSVR